MGSERHLCLADPAIAAAPAMRLVPNDAPSAPKPDEDIDEQTRFQLQLVADVESERILLYRVGIVLEFLAMVTLLRHCLLWYLGLS